MKKYISVIFATVLAFVLACSLCACAEDKGTGAVSNIGADYASYMRKETLPQKARRKTPQRACADTAEKRFPSSPIPFPQRGKRS